MLIFQYDNNHVANIFGKISTDFIEADRQNVKLNIAKKQAQKTLNKILAKQEEQQKKALVKSLNVNDTQQQKLNVLAMAASQPPFVNPLEVKKQLVKSLNVNDTQQEKLNVLAMVASQPPFVNPLEVKKQLVKSLNADISTPQEKLNVLAMAASEPSFVNPIPNPIKIQRLFRKIKARRERRKLLSLVEPLDTNMPQEKSDGKKD